LGDSLQVTTTGAIATIIFDCTEKSPNARKDGVYMGTLGVCMEYTGAQNAAERHELVQAWCKKNR
jgi:hypothetical protein